MTTPWRRSLWRISTITDDPGWIGPHATVLAALAKVDADCDENGRFLIGGANDPVVTFLGAGEQAVVKADAQYLRTGVPCALVPLLAATGEGMQVRVFG